MAVAGSGMVQHFLQGRTKDGMAKVWFENTFLATIRVERPQLRIYDGHRAHKMSSFSGLPENIK